MLKNNPKQHKLLFSPIVYEKLIPEDHFYRKLQACIDWKRIDTICRPLYSEGMGRPVINYPRKMFKADLLQQYHDWSDREMEEQATYNIAVKWFLELDVGEESFDHSALSKFRVKLGEKTYRDIFEDILLQIYEAGHLDFLCQFMDATSIYADIALLNTTALIKKTCRQLITAAKSAGYKLSVTFNEKERDKKRALKDAVTQAVTLLEDTTEMKEVETEREMLQSILSDYIEWKEETVRERKKKGKGRIVSPVDKDARYGVKSKKNIWPGYKLHNTMTENRFITAVEVTAADVTDDAMAVPLYDQQTFKPFIIPADALYGTGENWQAFDERGCLLIAPVRSQENPTGLYPKSRFSLGEGRGTCPAGKTTTTYTDNEESQCFQYRFHPSDCQQCPLKEQCTTGAYRTVSISYCQAAFDRATLINATEVGKIFQKKRRAIESKYAEMKNIHGLKRARYRGLERVTIQVLITAILVNSKNFIRLLMKSGQRKPSIPHG
ncbi:MAG: IS1182 family transposase [Theionarchaea archaeon]|nr:IS1182 family transposase [Theionarchaea archaeon]